MFIHAFRTVAQSAIGDDLLRDERLNVTSRPRIMRGVAFVGGNAINEASVSIYIEDYYVGRFYSTLNGAVGVRAQDDITPVGPHAVPAGSKVTAIINTAPTVSPVTLQIL